MKNHRYNDEKLDWGHLFVIAVVIFLAYTTAVRVGLVRVGKQAPVKQSEITVKGFQR